MLRRHQPLVPPRLSLRAVRDRGGGDPEKLRCEGGLRLLRLQGPQLALDLQARRIGSGNLGVGRMVQQIRQQLQLGCDGGHCGLASCRRLLLVGVQQLQLRRVYRQAANRQSFETKA